MCGYRILKGRDLIFKWKKQLNPLKWSSVIMETTHLYTCMHTVSVRFTYECKCSWLASRLQSLNKILSLAVA